MEFIIGYIVPTLIIVAQILAIVLPLLIAVAYLTYAERKVIGAMQLRKGPNVVGPFGLLQPLADGLKLFLKETVIPTNANKGVFLVAPMLTFILALVAWAVIPFDAGWVLADLNVGHSLYLCDFLAGRIRHCHGRLGIQFQICVFRGHAVRCADDFL